ncbi:hypothetical protein V5F32_00940 [Xanthobacter oligotrophicus]|uniref:Lipoprotein n=1 Tax=Xanthobacter oligotrophicus TaxID=2607286 RepID=A0ABW6ZPS7_9HYPH
MAVSASQKRLAEVDVCRTLFIAVAACVVSSCALASPKDAERIVLLRAQAEVVFPVGSLAAKRKVNIAINDLVDEMSPRGSFDGCSRASSALRGYAYVLDGSRPSPLMLESTRKHLVETIADCRAEK